MVAGRRPTISIPGAGRSPTQKRLNAPDYHHTWKYLNRPSNRFLANSSPPPPGQVACANSRTHTSLAAVSGGEGSRTARSTPSLTLMSPRERPLTHDRGQEHTLEKPSVDLTTFSGVDLFLINLRSRVFLSSEKPETGRECARVRIKGSHAIFLPLS